MMILGLSAEAGRYFVCGGSVKLFHFVFVVNKNKKKVNDVIIKMSKMIHKHMEDTFLADRSRQIR